MTVAIILSYVIQLLTAAGALGAVMQSLRNHKQVQELKITIDGRMDKLLELATVKGEGVGRAAERADVASELATKTAAAAATAAANVAARQTP